MSRLLSVIASVVPALLVAQVPDTTPVPRDLFAAYNTRYGGMGVGQPEFVIGQLPTADVKPFLPPQAQVLGGVVVRRRSGAVQTSSVALLMAGAAGEAQQRAIDHLRSSGLRPGASMMPHEEGFLPSESPMRDLRWFCADSTSVFVSSQSRAEGGSYVILQLDRIRQDNGGPCSQTGRQVSMQMRTPRELSFPVLEPPDGAVSRGGGGSGWSMDNKTRSIAAEIESELSVEAIVEHYTKEFVRHGWKAGKRLKQDNTVIQLLREGSGDTAREVVLSNVQLPDKTHQVTAQIYVQPKRVQ